MVQLKADRYFDLIILKLNLIYYSQFYFHFDPYKFLIYFFFSLKLEVALFGHPVDEVSNFIANNEVHRAIIVI